MKQSTKISRPLDAKMESGKEAAEKQEEEGESLRDFMFDHANDFFISHIPVDSIKEMETTYMYYYGFVAHILAISMFIYFTWENYESQVTQPFIVLSESDGSRCETVPIAITDTYLADSGGNWVGFPDFVYSQSLYSLALSNFEINHKSQYIEMMNTFKTALDEIGRVSMHQDLSENLLFWMSYIQYYDVENPSANFNDVGYGQLQSFQMTGNPQNVFQLDYIKGSVVGASGSCPLFSYSTFDQANSQLQNTYVNYTQFINDPICSAAVIPDSVGYVSYLDGDVYTITMDVRTFSTAMAVNYGVIPINNLKVVDKELRTFTYRNVSYTIAQYYDVRYPLMATVSCLKNTSVIPHTQAQFETLCFYVMGETFALPVFNHYGASPKEPTFCNCNNDIGSSRACNEFNLLSGLIFYKSNFQKIQHSNKTEILKDFGLFNLMTLIDKYPTYRLFNKAAYNVSFLGAASQYEPTQGDVTDAFNFCSLGNETCSLFLFNSFDPTGFEVSNYKYQVFNGSCANSTSISDSDWQKLIDVEPVQFTQNYFECYYSERESMVSALGIASGNVQIFIPIFVFILLPFLYASLVAIKQVPPKPEYTKEEKDQALEIFSMLLLRLRDGKTRGIKPRGVLVGLTKEMIAAAKEEGGYPDSDDEEDEIDDETAAGAHNKKHNRPSSVRSGRKRGSSGAESTAPITRLRNSSINSAQSDAVESNYGEDNAEYARTSTNFGGSRVGDRKAGTPVHGSHRPRMGVFTKHIVERNRIAQQQQIQQTQPVRQFSVSSGSTLARTNTSSSMFNPFARKTTVGTIQNPNRINSTIGGNKAGGEPTGALAYSSAALKSKNTTRGITASPIANGAATAATASSGMSTSTNVSVDQGSSNPSIAIPSVRSSAIENGNSTSATASSDVVPSKRVSTKGRSDSIFGYIFGGEAVVKEDNDERGSEMVAKGALEDTYIDLNVQLVPDGVRVLNLPKEDGVNRHVSKKSITGHDVDLLVDDLLRLFGEATHHHSVDHSASTTTKSSSGNSAENPIHKVGESGDNDTAKEDRELDPVDLDVSTTRDSFSLVQAKSLSVKLAQIVFEDLINREDKSIFLKLSNALCMHASIELKYEMKLIAHKYGDRVAYNIGGKLMTVNQMDSIL